MNRKIKSTPILLQLQAEFKSMGDAKKAKEMQAYMKSAMPYHGVQTPIRKVICKKIFSTVDFKNAKSWQGEVMSIWRQAKFREERYAALMLAGDKRAMFFQTPDTLSMYEEMIVTGAWWDYVDEIASHRVGGLLATYPKQMKPKMRRWSKSENMWIRRTSILCQLGFHEKTDLALLYSCIEPSIESKEFFLRKAIGWALRQYAWTDPKEVKRYVQANIDRLSPLSTREALKNIKQ